MTDPPDAAPGQGSRNVAPLPVEQRFTTQFDRWAIIVGISKYRDPRLNLTWAHRDAEKLFELIQTPVGGGFKPEHVRILVDEQATATAITTALRSFLQGPKPEDVVLLYFACHGTPDPKRASVVYLLTHETNPDDISATALPMREITLSLQENLVAERVVIIADTCHSASISGVLGLRSGAESAGAINAYLEAASRAKGGVALLTSAAANETAREGEEWGGGHGVFTHFLLRGLQGEADGYRRPKDGIVSVGELFEFVRDNVKNETHDQQHPAIGTSPFDRNLPMAVTGGVDARERLELGRRLLAVARQLDERERYLSAASRFREAMSLSMVTGAVMPEAVVGLGHALLAAGDPSGCAQEMLPLVNDQPPPAAEEALLLHGVALAKLGDAAAARGSLTRFLALSPDHDFAGWTRSYLNRAGQEPGRRLGLLIGINRYLAEGVPPLRGCVNDVHLMERALFGEAGAAGEDCVILADSAATKTGIANAFADLAARARPDDTVFVHYSGHAITDTAEPHPTFGDCYLLVHDTVDSPSGVSAAELDGWLRAIPSLDTTVVLDTHPHSAFLELADDADYRLLIASDSAERSYETTAELGGEVVAAGAFTGALTELLRTSDPETLTFGELLDATIGRLEAVNRTSASVRQVPVLVGDRDELVFGRGDVHLWAFDFGHRRAFPRDTVKSLRARRRRVPEDLSDAFTALDVSFGRAFIECGAYAEAMRVLEPVVQRTHSIDSLQALGTAALLGHRPEQAQAPLNELGGLVERPELSTALSDLASNLAHPRRFALLVGIDEYMNVDVPAARGAEADARLVRTALTERAGFDTDDVTMLVGKHATRTAIVDAFRELADRGRSDLAFFHFAGNGSVDLAGQPVLVSHDGRREGVTDIGLAELAAIASSAKATNLVSMIDASFGVRQPSESGRGRRGVPADLATIHATRDFQLVEGADPREPLDRFRVGVATILADPEEDLRSTPEPPDRVQSGEHPGLLGRKREYHGHLTYAFARALAAQDPSTLTWRSWAEGALLADMPTRLAGPDELDAPVFADRRVRESALAVLRRLDLTPFAEAAVILARLIDEREQQGDEYPAGWLELGVASAGSGDVAGAIEALERAVALYGNSTIMARERESDRRADAHLREAHYQLGRVLYEHGTDFTRAVSSLDRAVTLEPDNARALYYLGQAIRQMVENETLVKAAKVFKEYLAMGAPLGHEDDVREFIGSRGKPGGPATR